MACFSLHLQRVHTREGCYFSPLPDIVTYEPIPKLFQSLPQELILMVAKELDSATLSHFCRVSKSFCQWARGILYFHPSLDSLIGVKMFYETLALHPELTTYVRGLDIQIAGPGLRQRLPQIIFWCKSLCSLSLDRSIETRPELWSAVSCRDLVSLEIPWMECVDVAKLIGPSFPRLRSLVLHHYPPAFLKLPLSITSTYPASITLREVNLMNCCLDVSDLKTLFQQCPQLRCLHLDFYWKMPSYKFLVKEEVYDAFSFAPQNLRHLGVGITGHLDSEEKTPIWDGFLEYFLHCALSSCKSIRSLRAEHFFLNDEFLDSFGSRLGSLCLVCFEDEDEPVTKYLDFFEKVLDSFINAETIFPKLQRFEMRHGTQDGGPGRWDGWDAIRKLAEKAHVVCDIRHAE